MLEKFKNADMDSATSLENVSIDQKISDLPLNYPFHQTNLALKQYHFN